MPQDKNALATGLSKLFQVAPTTQPEEEIEQEKKPISTVIDWKKIAENRSLDPEVGKKEQDRTLEREEIKSKQPEIELSLEDNEFAFIKSPDNFERQFGQGHYGAQGLAETFKLDTPEKIVEFAAQNKKQQKLDQVQHVLDTPNVFLALEKGVFYQGPAQNFELLSGLDAPQQRGLSVRELDVLRNNGDITLEEYSSFLEDRSALPFLTALSAAVVNSALIAIELPTMGPVRLAGAGAKLFSWTGAGRVVKELSKLGWNSWKLMGFGANVKASRESYKELKEMENPTVGDYVGVVAKHAAIENVMASFEGVSEGLLPNLKFAEVPIKNLFKFGRKEWKNFGVNVLKKGITGFGFEATTEQTTDMLGDLMTGTNSSMIYAHARGTDEEKAQAFENLLIEGLTGLILGSSIGAGEVFGSSFHEEVVDMVEKGEITEDQGQFLVDATKDQETAKKFWNGIQAGNVKKMTPQHLREAKGGIRIFQQFGSTLQPLDQDGNPTSPANAGEQEHQEAMKIVEQSLPESVEAVDAELTKMMIEEHITPNIMDAITLLGKRNFIKYLGSLQEQDNEFNFIDDFKQNHPAYNMSNQVMNEVTTQAMQRIMYKAGQHGTSVLEALKTEMSELNEEDRAYFERDIIASIAMNVDDIGWNILGKKWEGRVAPDQLNRIIEQAKVLPSELTKPIVRTGQLALNQSFDQMIDSVNHEWAKKQATEAEHVKEERKKTISVVDDALGDVEGPTEGLEQRVFGENPKFTSVAMRTPEGKIHKGAPGDTHAIFYERFPALFPDDNIPFAGDMGFVDEEGIFYTSAQVRELGESGESISMGIGTPSLANQASLNALRKFDQVDFNAFKFREGAGLTTYGNAFKGYEGKTLNDLQNFMKGRDISDPVFTQLLDDVLPHVKNVGVEFVEDLPSDVAGRYLPKGFDQQGERIQINLNMTMTDTVEPLKTALHEALHAFTVGYMRSEEGKVFKAQVGQMMTSVRDVLRNPNKAIQNKQWMGSRRDLEHHLDQYKNDKSFVADLNNYLASEEEFLAAILSDTTRMRAFTENIAAISMPGEAQTTSKAFSMQNLWNWIQDKIETVWKNIYGGKKKGNIPDALSTLLRVYHTEIGTANTKQRNKQYSPKLIRDLRAQTMESTTFGLEEQARVEEQLDDEQHEVDESEEWQYANNVSTLAAEILDIDVNDFRNTVKKFPSIWEFYAYIDNIDQISNDAITERINKLWNEGGYKEKVADKKDFEFRFLTGLFTFLKSSKAVSFVTIKTNYENSAVGFEVEQQPFVFTQGDGVTRGSYGKNTVLDGMLNPLASIFGLDKGAATISYVSGFEVSRNNIFQARVSAKRLSGYHIGMEKGAELSTEILADKINQTTRNGSAVAVYLGNFGGNNTIPLINVPTAQYEQILRIAKNILQNLGGPIPTTEGAILTKAFRLVLEDLWFGRPPTSESQEVAEVSRLAENSVFKTMEFGDINKIWKRGKKFLVEDNFVATDEANVKLIVKNNQYTGMSVVGGEHKDIMLRTMIFNSQDDGTIEIITGFDKKNQPIKQLLPMQSILVNNYSTEKTDGVIYYLLDEFDTVYHKAHGTIKDGTIKAVYSSRMGEQPMYLKFSLQGISKKSAIGLLMIKNNVALLASDTSAKLSQKQPVNLSGTQTQFLGGDQVAAGEPTFQLNLKNIQRIKEELSTDITSGTVKQMLNSSGLTLGNPFLKENVKYFKAVKDFTTASGKIAIEKLNELASPTGLLKILRGIVENPQSPRERVIARTLRSLLQLEDKEFLKSYGGIMNHPTIAKQLRQRLYRPVDSAIQGRIGGMRNTLRPDVGWGNQPGNIDPVDNPYTKDMLLISQPNDAPIIKHAFPEAGLATLVRGYVELQRQESRMLSKNTGKKMGYWIPNLKLGGRSKAKEVTQKEFIDWAKEDTTNQIKALGGTLANDNPRRHDLLTGDIRAAINNRDPFVQQWKTDVIFGKAVEEGITTVRKGGILDSISGSVNEDHVIITEDFAKKYGLKPGDKVLAVITPTDSPLGIIAITIAGIAPVYGDNKATDRMSAVFNSEYIQSIVGKDFDIDTISMIPYDPDYWTAEGFSAVWENTKKMKGDYKKWLSEEATALLGRPIGIDEVFGADIYPEFMRQYIVKYLGNKDTGKIAGVEELTAQEHFFEVDRAYLMDPNKAIVRRQFHSMLSAIGLESDVININKNKNNWKRAHLLHLIDTNLSVDFPNKTDRLLYNPAESEELKRNFAQYEWNADLTNQQIDATMEFFRFAFGDALTLARGRDPIEGQTLTYHQFRQHLEKQKKILALISTGDIGAVIGAWTTMKESKLSIRLNEKRRLSALEAISQRAATVQQVLQGFKVKDVNDYSLFQMINSIDTGALPMPGLSYTDWLIDQAVTTREVLETDTNLSEIFTKYVKEDQKKAERNLVSRREGVEYDGVTKYAIWMSLFPLELDYQAKRKNQKNSLDSIRNEIISLIQAYDEIETDDAPSETLIANRKGRAFAYPKLFEALLESRRIVFKQPGFVSLTHGKDSYGLALDATGKPLIKINDGAYRFATDVLTSEDAASKKARAALTEEGGVWEEASNRAALTNGLSLVKNVPGEVRLKLAKQHIENRLYSPHSPKFRRNEVQALWLSFMGQVSWDGIEDSKTPGLITAQYQLNEKDVTDFQGNDIALELMSEFERPLYYQWMAAMSSLNQNMNRQDQEMGIRGLMLDPEASVQALEQRRFDETDGAEVSKMGFKMLTDVIHDQKADIGHRKFVKLIKKEGYKAGLKIVKGMVRNDVYLEALGRQGMWYGDLVHDISHLSAKAFEKKYEKKDIEVVNAIVSQKLADDKYVDSFFKQQMGVTGYENLENVGKLIEIFQVLRASQKSKYRADSSLSAFAKKVGITYVSYQFLGPEKEHKIYSSENPNVPVDHKFTQFGVQDLTLREVDLHRRIYSTRTFQAHGESSVVMAKNQVLNMTINLVQTQMSDLVSSMDEVIELISDPVKRDGYITDENALIEPESAEWLRRQFGRMSDLTPEEIWNVRARIFEVAENMKEQLNIEIMHDRDGNVIGYTDLMTNTAFENQTAEQFIDALFGNHEAQRKVEIFAALKIRELYDVKVPDILEKAVDYLKASRDSMQKGGNLDSLLEIDALIERYEQYLNSVLPKWGNYMPHMYPVELYKTWWQTEYKQLVTQGLAARVMREQAKHRQGKPDVDMSLVKIDMKTPEGKEVFNAKVLKQLNHEWEQFKVGNPTTYIIPNFLARKVPDNIELEYIKGSTEMHYNYVNNLMTALRNDILYADWLTYLHKARRAGERTYLIEMTKMWFGDQVQNKMLHTKSIVATDLKPGMQINFANPSYTITPDSHQVRVAGIQTWGVVESMDNKTGILKLKVDRDAIVYRAKKSIASTEKILEDMSPEDVRVPASMRQIAMIKNMLQRGYLDAENITIAISSLTVKQASNLILHGHHWVIDNIDKIGVYNVNETYRKNLRGEPEYATFGRYMRRGAVEKLDGLAREVDSLKGEDGTYDNKMDDYLYKAYKYSGKTIGAVASAIKTTQAMTFLGMVAAPKAFMNNFLGAKASNLLDSPIAHWKLGRQAKKEWKLISGKSPSKMNAKEKEWYNIMVSLGLGRNKDLVAISLQAGNIDPIDILAQEGKLDAVRYLAKGIIEGGQYEKYLKRLDQLRTELIQSDFDPKIELEIMKEETLWRAKVNGLIEQKLYKNKFGIKKKKGDKLITRTAQHALTSEERIQIFKDLSPTGKKQKDKKSFVEEANLTRTQALKQAAKLVKNSILRGDFGLGLQARAESQRRPGFYIGYKTAKDMGFTNDQALIMGVNSIEHRHAFYSNTYKQFGANTKLGALMFQFSQYGWNNFEKNYRIWKEGIPQFYRHWATARIAGANPFKAFWETVMKRTTPMVDAMGKQMRSVHGKNMAEVNMAHMMSMRIITGSMLMQAGTRIFGGITNWQDPMIQMTYKIFDYASDLLKGDVDDDEMTEILYLLNDVLFFVGVPYKLALQMLNKDRGEDMIDHQIRGRIHDQVDFALRVNNEIAILNNEYLRGNKEYNRNLESWEWWFDDFFAGVKFFGYTKPDVSGQPYPRWGFYPGFSDEFPFVMRKEFRMIQPLNNMRYIDTNKQGEQGLERLWKHAILEPHLTFLPFLDKFYYPHKKDR